MKITIKLNTLIVVLLASLVIVLPSALAATITTQATSGNPAPKIAGIEINDSTPAPGVDLFVSANISDESGYTDISSVNVTCVSTIGTNGTDSWDSITILNSSGLIAWTLLNTTAYRINASINTSVNYWSTKSANGTWTCTVNATDVSGQLASESATMTVDKSTGISVKQSTCIFDTASPGTADKQWTCSGDRNETISHDGNIHINITILGAKLVGQTNPYWNISVGNITWNSTYGFGGNLSGNYSVGGDLPGTVLTETAYYITDTFPRGASQTRNITNVTAWLDYPLPLEAQTYSGTITLTSEAAYD